MLNGHTHPARVNVRSEPRGPKRTLHAPWAQGVRRYSHVSAPLCAMAYGLGSPGDELTEDKRQKSKPGFVPHRLG
eukprot:5259569-Prymnesium_polylepis.2